MLKLKIMFHAILANYHSHMMASIFNKHDSASTKLYLKHWLKYTKHSRKEVYFRMLDLKRSYEDEEIL